MANTPSIFSMALPFTDLTDYEIEQLYSSSKNEILSRLENDNLIKYLKNVTPKHLQSASHDINCMYYTEEEFNFKIRNVEGLSVFHMNIRKLGKHRGELLAYLGNINLNFDVIILTEVGKNAEPFIQSLFNDYTPFHDLPKINNYGGVAIYVKNILKPIDKPELKITRTCNCSKCQIEDIWVQFQYNGKVTVVGGVYRHPGGNIGHFTNDLDKILFKCRGDTSIIAGDFNIDLIKTESHYADYFSTLTSHNFIPYITRPTRITAHTATLVDHIYMKVSKDQVNNPTISGNLFSDISDHLPNFLIVSNTSKTTNKKLKHKTRIFSKTNIEKFNNELNNIQWSRELLVHETVDSMCECMMYLINRSFYRCFPLVNVSIKRSKDKPWISKELRKSIEKKNKLYKKSILDPSPHNVTTYKNAKATVEKEVNASELRYYQNILTKRRSSIKSIWKEFGPILGRNKKHGVKIQKLKFKNKILTNNQEIANALNQNFCEIGPKLAANIPNIGKNFKSYLGPSLNNTFFISPVTPNDILEELLKLDPKKSAGPDGLTPKIIRSCAYTLHKPLALLFNKSIEMGIYPEKFQLAKVIPIYKSAEKCNPSNYRPISLLNCFDKIFERLINNQLVNFINKHNVLFKYQYAFRAEHSTDFALIEMTDFIKMQIDSGNYAVALYIDLKKAFDTVDHSILLEKIKYYGIRGHGNNFFESYLGSRTQYVHCNTNIDSEILKLPCGVPQGSILGPTLFLLYVNDMYKCINDEIIRLFADDTICLVSGACLKNVFERVKKCLSRLRGWLNANKLTLNLDKTCYSIFHSKRKIIPNEFNSISFENHDIKRCTSTKYLGVTIDEVLSWTPHIELLKNYLMRYFSVFYQLRNVLPIKMKLQIFHAYVYSKISYGLRVYGSAMISEMNALQILCNKLLRVFLKRAPDYSTNKLHKENDLLKINDLHKVLVLQYVHRSVYAKKNTPDNIKEYFKRNTTVHAINTRDKLLLHAKYQIKTAMGASSIYWKGVSLWNNLPLSIREIRDVKQFKNSLKLHFMASYQ